MTFPLVEAFLIAPDEGKEGNVAICTNSLAPGMVINEIPLPLRKHIPVMGSLVVNRDGAERMILNTLAHPTIEYLILFGEETLSFRPSTNLLSALVHGYTEEKGNQIVNGKGIAHHYPNISVSLLEKFRKRVKVLPLYKHKDCDAVVDEYLTWLSGKVPQEVYEKVKEIRGKKKIYYNHLVELLEVIAEQPAEKVEQVVLDEKDFQHLAPPIIEIEEDEEKPVVPFEVSIKEKNIRLTIDIEGTPYQLEGNDSFLMAYSLMKFLQEKEKTLPPLHQLLIGAELSRVEIELRNDITMESFVTSEVKQSGRQEIPLKNRTLLKADKKYYYKMGLREDAVYVQSMAHDTCENVFELRGKDTLSLIKRIDKENRFDDYEQTFLHRADVGIEIGRAGIAFATGNQYFQDFRNLFKLNTTDFPLFVIEGDNFLQVHQKIITSLYTKGLTTDHPDAHKGPMRSGSILAVYRRSEEAFSTFPNVYRQGESSTEEMREAYKAQLLSTSNEGEYTYGERTRKHFGFDQLEKAIAFLKQHPNQPFVVQRYDYAKDMYVTEEEITNADGTTRTRIEATHDPCLSHDIYFIQDGKLHSFHIARAHNIVNAYPENLFGLHDAYDTMIAKGVGVELGDMFMLSSRGNLLLLTEEQKAKQLIAEPCKPQGDVSVEAGPADMNISFPEKGIGYEEAALEEREDVDHPCLESITHYQEQNLVEKVAAYLKKRGQGHNNPILGAYEPGEVIQHAHRLIFFQCNARAGKIHATAVFVDGEEKTKEADKALCDYLATKISKKLGLPLGKLFFFYVPVINNV